MTTATMTKPKRRNAGISLLTSSVKAALAAVKAAVPSRSPKPVLRNVLLANGTLTASDLELQITTPLEYEGSALLLPFDKLQAILNAARGDEMTIEPDGAKAVVRIGGGSWTLPTEDATEFPTWQPQRLGPVCTLPSDQFCRIVKSVVYATDNESSRYALGAVNIEVSRTDENVSFVATDGRRLSCATAPLSEQKDPDSRSVLAPAKAMAQIAMAAAHRECAVKLEASAAELQATVGETVITARLVEGRFPPWRDVFPERDAKASLISAGELLDATRQAMIVTSEQSKGVTYAVTSDGVRLTAASSESGESDVTCGIVELGQAATVKLDPQFVVDLLRSVDLDEPLEVEVVDAQSAVVFRSGDDHKAVIMPLAND